MGRDKAEFDLRLVTNLIFNANTILTAKTKPKLTLSLTLDPEHDACYNTNIQMQTPCLC